MRVVAFTGPKQSGKDTCGQMVLNMPGTLQRMYFTHINFAHSVKEICRTAFALTDEEMEDGVLKERRLDRWPFLTPRQIMQDVANHFRKAYGEDIWARRWTEKVQATRFGCVVTTDLRFPDEELIAIDLFDHLIVYVQNDRAEADLKAKRAAGDPLASNISEAHYDRLKAEADVIVYNNGTLLDLAMEVESKVVPWLGKWRDWEVPVSTLHMLRTGGK